MVVFNSDHRRFGSSIPPFPVFLPALTKRPVAPLAQAAAAKLASEKFSLPLIPDAMQKTAWRSAFS
jgi:hypothetical protein